MRTTSAVIGFLLFLAAGEAHAHNWRQTGMKVKSLSLARARTPPRGPFRGTGGERRGQVNVDAGTAAHNVARAVRGARIFGVNTSAEVQDNGDGSHTVVASGVSWCGLLGVTETTTFRPAGSDRASYDRGQSEGNELARLRHDALIDRTRFEREAEGR